MKKKEKFDNFGGCEWSREIRTKAIEISDYNYSRIRKQARTENKSIQNFLALIIYDFFLRNEEKENKENNVDTKRLMH